MTTEKSNIKVLVDHGCHNHNLGDFAQLAGLISELTANQRLDLQVRSTPCDGLLPLPGQPHERARFSIPFFQSSWLLSCPFAWRFEKIIGSACNLANYKYAQYPRAFGHPGKRCSIQIASEADALWLTGGGYFTDTFGHNLYEKCCLIHAFADQGKTVVLSGQQIGPFRSRASRDAVYKALRRADLIGVREPEDSIRHAKACGIDHSLISLSGDDSFGMASDESGAQEVLKVNGIPKRGFLAINFREANYAGTSKEHAVAFAQYVSRIQKALKVPAVFVPISMASGDSDLAAGHRLQSFWPRSAEAPIVLGESLTAQVAKAVLGLSTAAAGGSYHFCTFALCAGTQAISLYANEYYQQKSEGLAAFWQDQVLPIRLNPGCTDLAVRESLPFLQNREASKLCGDEGRSTWKDFIKLGVDTITDKLYQLVL